MISNRARFIIWLVMLFIGWVAGYYITRIIGLPCSPLCLLVGAALLIIILRASAVAGRYLAVYGKTGESRGFGDFRRLVREGPYSCMRHPMHLFLSLLPPAIGFLTLNPGMAYITGPVLTVSILVMALLIDEKESIERFGEEYIRYKDQVPAFSLDPRCLAKALLRRPPKNSSKTIPNKRNIVCAKLV